MKANSELIEELHSIASILRPLATSSPDSVLGKKRDSKHYGSKPDPLALSLYSILNAVADMAERQNGPFTNQQLDYLGLQLFGAAGSVADAFFSPRRLGIEAGKANAELANALQRTEKVFKRCRDMTG